MNRWIVGMIGIAGVTSGMSASMLAAQGGPPQIASVADIGQWEESVQTKPSALATKVSVAFHNAELKAALRDVAQQAGLRITVGEPVLSLNHHVTLSAKNVPAESVLKQLVQGSRVAMAVTPSGHVVFSLKADGEQAEGVVSGKVVSAKTKQPVAGATVVVDNAGSGVTTGENGMFRVSASAGERTLRVRGLGFVKQEVKITVTEGKTVSVEIVLEPSASVLDQVVVTGTVVSTERKALSTPITVITAEDIEKRGVTRIDQLFRGEVPGLMATERGSVYFSSDDPGAAVQTYVYSRGVASVFGTPNPPKVYIDGVELVDANFLGTLDPQSIERMEIVTGPQAATLYGSGAVGGVIQIFLKHGSGSRAPEATVKMKYGMLESNLSSARTPRHENYLNVLGGSRGEFTYSINLSHTYMGEWQPDTWQRSIGGQLGVAYDAGPLTARGSVSLTRTHNGASSGALMRSQLHSRGIYAASNNSGSRRLKRKSTADAQTLAFGIDFRPSTIWQHHLSVGRGVNDFTVDGIRPVFVTPADSMISFSNSTGSRNSVSYNMTLIPDGFRWITTNFTLGGTGQWGSSRSLSGLLENENASAYQSPSASRSLRDRNYGGFGRAQIGVAGWMFANVGLRAEVSPNYGDDHSVSWAPTTGVSLVYERSLITTKVFASYGRATRPPGPERKQEVIRRQPLYTPSEWIGQQANFSLRPEISSGPQVGVEIYFGNMGALTLNHYQQEVRDQILSTLVDSVATYYQGDGPYYQGVIKNINAANVKQKGWEGTASLSVRGVLIKGTYSWNDSRVGSLNAVGDYIPGYGWIIEGRRIKVGSPFGGVPTHLGNVTAEYAVGATSIAVVNNWIGAYSDNSGGNFHVRYLTLYGRLRQYQDWAVDRGSVNERRQGYIKTNVSIQHRLSSWVSLSLDVANAGNSQGSEQTEWYPVLGRQTALGVSLTFPMTR